MLKIQTLRNIKKKDAVEIHYDILFSLVAFKEYDNTLAKYIEIYFYFLNLKQ